MSSIQIFHRAPDGDETVVGVLDGDRIKAHSARVRALVAAQPPKIMYRFTFSGPTAESLKIVLDQINALPRGQVLQIAVNTRNLVKAIDIHRAIECLQIEPDQGKIVGHLNGYLSHEILTAEEMVAVHLAYGTPGNKNHKTWSTMIHTIAYRWVGGDVPQSVADELKGAAMQHPTLDAALNAKVDELQAIKTSREEAIERRVLRDQRRAAREEKRAAKRAAREQQ